MNAITALARLRALGRPVLTTGDAALALDSTPSAISRMLSRLTATRPPLVQRIRHGLWAVNPPLDPLLLPEYLTAPFPAYVSFHSALYLHGMVSQIPGITYVASLAQTRRVATELGTFSIHRLSPQFFGGYENAGASGVALATPEKALLDTLYLGPTRSRLFAHTPEIELPPRFSRREADGWLERIPEGPRRAGVKQRLDRILAGARASSRESRRRSSRRQRADDRRRGK